MLLVLIKGMLLSLLFGICLTSCAHQTIIPIFPCTEVLQNSYGVNCHLAFIQDYTRRDAELAMMNKIGINMVRGGSHFFTLGYRDGQFNPLMKDSIVQSIEKAGIPMHGDLSLDAFGKKCWEDMEAYARYVDYITERYNGKIDCWEVANEVDLAMKTDSAAYKYAQVLKHIYPFFKKNSKKNKVLVSGLAYVTTPFLDSLCNYGAHNYFDVMNFHTYDNPENLPMHFNALRATMNKHGWEKEVWLGECGMHTAPDTTKTNNWSNKAWLEQEQARRLPRIYLISFAYGINKVYWYEIRAEEKEPYYMEHHFGLLHSDLSPKPAFKAYETLIKMCPDGSSRPELIKRGNDYLAHWVTPNDKDVWAVWSVGNLTPSLSISGRAKYFDIYGKKLKDCQSINESIIYIVGAKTVSF